MFEDYLLEHFAVERVSGGTQFLLHDECPFCSSTGKVYIDRKKGVGICFKCGTGFGPAKFIAEHQGISVSKARQILAGRVGYQQLECEEEPEEMAVWFPPTVPVDQEHDAANYLAGRGIDAEMVARYGVAFCRENTFANSREWWTRNRIIIPMYNRDWECVGWQGRDITGKSKMKYLFMPGFDGRENLFNIGNVQPGAHVILTEGVFHVFGWERAGIPNSVGSFGKKVSQAQVEMLVELDPSVLFVAWDTDATDKKYEFVEQHGHRFKKTRIVDLEGKDADELNKKALLKAISRAKAYDWSEKVLALL